MNGDNIINFTSAGSNEKIADLKWLGWYFNNNYHSLNDNIVNGVEHQKVLPKEDETILTSKLIINGLDYYLDNWIDSNGVIQVGYSGTSDNLNGYSIDFSYNNTYIRLKWNNIVQKYGGFNINDIDQIQFLYYT